MRHAALARSEEAYAALPLLRQATVNVAHPAIRNRGTTVGSIAHADPAGEMPAVLALCDGVVEAVSATGTREIGWADFFAGALETSLRPEELAVGSAIRPPARRHTHRLHRVRPVGHGDYAMAGVGRRGDRGRRRRHGARASFVSVTDVPSVLDLGGPGRCPAGRRAGLGSEQWASAVEAAAAAVRDHVQPESDIHATSDYRRMLVGELTRRCSTRAPLQHRRIGDDRRGDSP